MELTTKHLEEAIIFATEKHEGMVRKGDGRPYIMHPLSVMQHLYKYKKSKNINLLAIATVCHDLLEDTKTTTTEIVRLFGLNVASIVTELTTDEEKKNKVGKAQYLLTKMLGMSSYALVIKLCDRLDNIMDMKSMSDSFIKKYIKETNFILDGLCEDDARKLTRTHKCLIRDIRKTMKTYEK